MFAADVRGRLSEVFFASEEKISCWISILSHTPGVWLKIEIQLTFITDAKKTSDRRLRQTRQAKPLSATNYLLSFCVPLADFSAQNGFLRTCRPRTSADMEIFFNKFTNLRQTPDPGRWRKEGDLLNEGTICSKKGRSQKCKQKRKERKNAKRRSWHKQHRAVLEPLSPLWAQKGRKDSPTLPFATTAKRIFMGWILVFGIQDFDVCGPWGIEKWRRINIFYPPFPPNYTNIDGSLFRKS